MTNLHQGYGFIEFLSEEDAYYTIKLKLEALIYRLGLRVIQRRLRMICDDLSFTQGVGTRWVQDSRCGYSSSTLATILRISVQMYLSCSSNDTSSDLGDPEKKKLYEAKLWVKPWLNFNELHNSSLMVMMPLPLLPLILDAKGIQDHIERRNTYDSTYNATIRLDRSFTS
ncbi:hypothetical protein F2Q69_00051047 [Brassica cretica]|uniref:RRM domain-containing protein n=1 Tax=Brassica cretica TaxID=69181 RepID=A0A8S9Q1U7_BRACR|nr:hypothetical protein F2Q69_00051047 [Brassica cretica]